MRNYLLCSERCFFRPQANAITRLVAQSHVSTTLVAIWTWPVVKHFVHVRWARRANFANMVSDKWIMTAAFMNTVYIKGGVQKMGTVGREGIGQSNKSDKIVIPIYYTYIESSPTGSSAKLQLVRVGWGVKYVAYMTFWQIQNIVTSSDKRNGL